MKKLSLVFISMIISLNCHAAITLIGPAGAPDFSGIATFELSDLMPTSFGTQIPALVFDGTTTDAKNIFATGVLFKGTGNDSVFYFATQDIIGGTDFSADMVFHIGGASSTGGVGNYQVVVNSHTGATGNGGSVSFRVKGSDNGTGGNFEVRTDPGVGLILRHADSVGTIGHCLVSISTTGKSNWAPCPVPAATFLSATSSEKTPGANSDYMNMTGNEITITPGSWTLYGVVEFNSSGTCAYTSIQALWALADGTDANSAPTNIESIADAGDINVIDVGVILNASGNNRTVVMNSVRVTVAANDVIFLVPRATATTIGNCRVTTHTYAEEIP